MALPFGRLGESQFPHFGLKLALVVSQGWTNLYGAGAENNALIVGPEEALGDWQPRCLRVFCEVNKNTPETVADRMCDAGR
jgi:hypothetical protein